MSRPLRYLICLALVLAAAALSGCGTSSDQALRTTLAALEVPPVTQSTSPPGKPEPKCANVTASLRPPATMPAPGAMPPRSFMAAIQRRGHLIAGVNAGALNFGYLDPATGKIQGFEIDLVRELARAIFGNPNDYTLVALTVNQRIPFVQQGKVDVVVDTMTITCKRRTEVDFSTVYYDATQRLLVPVNSGVKNIGQLANKKVCASKGSTPIDVMNAMKPDDRPIPIGMPQAIDCLVALQQGRIAGISTDSSILLGFAAQDPNTEIVGSPVAPAPYGMAINKAHPEFVRFVNGVLAKLKSDGTWQRLYKKWLGDFTQGSIPSPPPAQYDG